ERHYRAVEEGAPSMMVVPKVESDLDNLRAALEWAGGSQGDARMAIALFGAAVAGHGSFFYAPLKAGHWIEMLRPLVDASIAPVDAARFFLACAGWESVRAPLSAAADAERALALYAQAGDRMGSC